MGNYSNLKSAIESAIKTNGNGEITGEVLQTTLLSIVNTIGANATFAGIATPSTNPGSPDQNVFYIASQAGVYANFRQDLELPAGLHIIFSSANAWAYSTVLTSATTSKHGLMSPADRGRIIYDNILSYSVGQYFDTDGDLISYRMAKLTELLHIPTVVTVFRGLWNTASGYGIIFLDKDGNYVGHIDTGVISTDMSFTWDPQDVSVPENAKFIVLQTQSSEGVNIESSQTLTTGISFQELRARVGNTKALEANLSTINSLSFRKADLITSGKNLFDPNAIIEGYFINSTTGKLHFDGESAVSDTIPVEPGAFYFVRRPGGTTDECRFLASDKVTILKPAGFSSFQIGLSSAVTAPEGAAYIQFAVRLKNYEAPLDAYQLEKGNTFTGYEPYSASRLCVPMCQLPREVGTIGNKADLVAVHGKNLFNPANIKEGYYIHGSIGVESSNATSAVSSLIPVKPGESYYLHRSGSIGTSGLRFVEADGRTPIPSNTGSGNLYEPGYSLSFIVPENAAYVQFTIKFLGSELTNIQLEKGSTFTGYEPYYERKIVDYPQLPAELEKLASADLSTNNDTISIENSDKIGFFSNSFLNGYCMLGKHAINIMSMHSDYIMYNYGHSGDDLLELLSRVNANETWLGDVPVQNWGIKYGVIAMQDNDGGLFAFSSDTYYENAKKLANSIKAMGATPILSTEHDWNQYYYNFARLSQEEGYMLMNWGLKAQNLYNSIFAPFWHNGHPATRTAWMWAYGMMPYLNTLPRPMRSLKLFRARNQNLTPDNLMFDSIVSRAKIYEELTCGVSCLTEGTDKYFDRLDTTNDTYTSQKDEYQKLQYGNAVSFGKYALAEFITPYDRNNLKSMSVEVKGSGISRVLIKKINSLENPLDPKTYIAFGVTSGIENLSIGSTITISSGVFSNTLIGTYTISAIHNNTVITTTASADKTTSGTDNPVCDISGVTLKGSYKYPSGDYTNRYDKPLGEWLELSIEDSLIIIPSDIIKNCVDLDKVSVLLCGENISLTGIKADITGDAVKNVSCSPLVKELGGESVLSNPLFDDEASWDGLSNLSTYSPVKSTINGNAEPLPKGINVVKILQEGQSVSQEFSIALQSEQIDLQIQVTARYFPEYIDTDTKWSTSEIKRGTYDCAELEVLLASSADDKNPLKIGVIQVGAWWNTFIINTPYYATERILILKCREKHVQIASCKMVKVN